MVIRHRLARKKSQRASTDDPKSWPGDERISYAIQNPKSPGFSAFERYQKYKYAKTKQEALDKGAALGDIDSDYKKGYLTRRPRAKSNAIGFAISLGTRCVVAEALRDTGLRRFSCPFDWIYSSGEMVIDCLKDDFKKFLDVSQVVKSGPTKFGHKFYSAMLNRGIIYPHHDPKKEGEAFRRRVSRLNVIMKSKSRKLFVFCNVIESTSAAKEAKEGKGKEFIDIFTALRKKRCSNFELIAVNMLCGDESNAAGPPKSKEAIVSRLKCGKKVGNNSLVVYELHCRGPCTGLVLKDKKDRDALAQLINGDRNFDLAEDPLLQSTAKKRPASKSSSYVLHPKRTVKKILRGHWRMKAMD